MSMRNWSKCILTVAILFISVTIPTVDGAAGDLGFAEDVETLSGSSIGWANLGNGDVAIVNETGNITAMKDLLKALEEILKRRKSGSSEFI